MKTKVLLNSLVLVALIVSMLGATAVAQDPPSEEQIEESVVLGLEWLVDQQNSDGSWIDWDESEAVAATCLVLLKLEDRAHDRGFDTAFHPDYEYAANVEAGWNYVFGGPYVYEQTPLPDQPAGVPDTNGNGYGLYFAGHPTYTTGICLMALIESGAPDTPNQGGLDFNGDGNADTFAEIAQEAVDWLAFAQGDFGYCQGGWGYGANDNACSWADNSNSGYATLGLGYAQLDAAFGLTVPQFVNDELNFWIDYIQNDVDGDTNDGGSGYSDPNSWVNILKTGNLIYEMGLYGDNADTQRVKDAVDYIEQHWTDGDCGSWSGEYQAAYTMMKGLESLGIHELDTGSGPFDWFEEVALHLIATQNGDGSWPDNCWGGQILSTTWALLTLEKAVPIFEIPVPVDIHPTSCPNPINTKSKGTTPVAILGTEDFDVTQIDPVTVVLFNAELAEPITASPLRWELEDVATPYEPYLDKPMDIYACTEEGPDGFMDMTLKFDTKELVAAMGDVNDGDAVKLTLTGNLLEEFGGTPIVGEDVVKILEKGK